MAFASRTGREVECFGASGTAAISEGEAPQPIDHDRLVFFALEQPEELTAHTESPDGAAAEVADQELACVRAERAGRYCQTPGRIDLVDAPPGRRPCDQACKGMGNRVEDVDQSVAPAWIVIVFRCVLLGEGHVDGAVE